MTAQNDKPWLTISFQIVDRGVKIPGPAMQHGRDGERRNSRSNRFIVSVPTSNAVVSILLFIDVVVSSLFVVILQTSDADATVLHARNVDSVGSDGFEHSKEFQ